MRQSGGRRIPGVVRGSALRCPGGRRPARARQPSDPVGQRLAQLGDLQLPVGQLHPRLDSSAATDANSPIASSSRTVQARGWTVYTSRVPTWRSTVTASSLLPGANAPESFHRRATDATPTAVELRELLVLS